MTHPIASIFYLIEGFKLIVKPGLKRFVAIPLLINFILFIGLFFLARHFISEFNAWFANYLPAWLHWLSGILWMLFFISFFLILIYTFVFFANLVSAPFNSFLAEKVEAYLGGEGSQNLSMRDNIKDIP